MTNTTTPEFDATLAYGLEAAVNLFGDSADVAELVGGDMMTATIDAMKSGSVPVSQHVIESLLAFDIDIREGEIAVYKKVAKKHRLVMDAVNAAADAFSGVHVTSKLLEPTIDGSGDLDGLGLYHALMASAANVDKALGRCFEIGRGE